MTEADESDPHRPSLTYTNYGPAVGPSVFTYTKSDRKPSDHSTVRCKDDPEEEEKRQHMTDLITTFMINSTAHGVPKIVSARSVVGKLFWICIILGAIVAFSMQGVTLLQRFFSYPTSIRLEVANQPIPFPAVSVCSIRPLDVFTYGNVFYDDSETFRWKIGVDLNYKGNPNTTAPVFEKMMVDFSNSYIAYRGYAEVLSEIANSESVFWKAKSDLLSRLTLVSNLNKTGIEQGGVLREQFIARCEYAGDKCSYLNFSQFVDPAYMNCYTFNISSTDKLQTVYEGPDNGLTMILFLPSMKIMNYSEAASARIALHQGMTLGGEGVRVVIHGQESVPYPLTEGLDIPRGLSASIGLQLKQEQRLEQPHGNCTRQRVLAGWTDYTYNMASCKKLCLQELVMDTCGCFDVSLPLPGQRNISLCAQFDTVPDHCRNKTDIYANYDECREFFEAWFERVRCMRDTRSNISKNLSAWDECSCQPKCLDSSYNVFYSLADWPMYEQAEILSREILGSGFVDSFHKDKARKYFGGFLNGTATHQDYRLFIEERNLMRLNIYISDTTVVKVVETEAYSSTQLISDVGGQLGLWIGVSIITLVETLELISKLLRYCFQKFCDCKASPRPSKDTKHKEARAMSTFPQNGASRSDSTKSTRSSSRKDRPPRNSSTSSFDGEVGHRSVRF